MSHFLRLWNRLTLSSFELLDEMHANERNDADDLNQRKNKEKQKKGIETD